MVSKKRWLTALLLAFLLLPCCAFAELTATFLDVGQGNAALIQADGKTMLIDTGSVQTTDALLSDLSQLGVTKIDILVGSLLKEEHIGAMAEVLAAYTVGEIWMANEQSDKDAYTALKQAAQNQGLSITVPAIGVTYALGSVKVTALAPVNPAGGVTDGQSLVLLLVYDDVRLLFTGDADTLEEGELLQSGVDVNADLLLVGAHGDSAATSQEFLDAVSPQWAVISCGSDNADGTPHSETLTRLQVAGATVLRTDQAGTLTFSTDGKIIRYQQQATIGRTNAKSVNMRESASTKAKKVTTLAKGDLVTIVGSTVADGDTWYQVEVGGKEGYIRGDLITLLSGDEAAAALSATPTPKPEQSTGGSGNYIGNKNSKKFHKPSCHTLPDEKNRVYFSSREKAINAGYVPCKNCDP
jgi:competence protein ComEC